MKLVQMKQRLVMGGLELTGQLVPFPKQQEGPAREGWVNAFALQGCHGMWASSHAVWARSSSCAGCRWQGGGPGREGEE